MPKDDALESARSALAALPPLREIIARYDLSAEKKLGQNFLLDQNVTDKIAGFAGDLTGLHVLEIGPGPGGLTRSLLRAGARSVTAVEFDPRAVRALESLRALVPGRVNIIEGDALTADFTALVPPPRAIVANLPYNIATTLLIQWLRRIREERAFDSMTLMFQKEVAERIIARPATKPYGRLSVISQWLCDAKKVYDLPPSAFTPPPKVSSAVVHFTPKILPEDAPSFEDVGDLTAAAFGQRRKMIRSSLKNYAHALEVLGIDPEKRAENLTIDNFIDLARYR